MAAMNRTEPLFHYSSMLPLPQTKYDLTVTYEISSEDKPLTPENATCLEATIEIRTLQKYALLLEPIKGQRISLENDFVVSPELTSHFNIPLSLFFAPNGSPAILHWQDNFIQAKLSCLPINDGLAQFLNPRIVHHAGEHARKLGLRREFKMIFYVKVTKVDLADTEECDRIRRGWLTSIPGYQSVD